MLRGFRDFLMRGNVIDLAVAFVVGAAFNSVVTALVKDFVTPLIAAVGGQPDFAGLFFTINGSRFMYGDFLNAAISFVMVAAAVYFLVVAPTNAVRARRKPAEAPPVTRKCPECLSEIPVAAHRCASCTSAVVPVA